MRIGRTVRISLIVASLAASPLGGQIAQQVGWPVDAPGDWNIYSSGVCDLDLDGFPEVIGMNVGSHRMWNFEGTGALATGWVIGEDIGTSTGDMLTFGDVNGDGVPEVFYQHHAYVYFIFGRSANGAELPYSPLVVGECCHYIERFALYDLDGDGAQELIVLDSYSLPRIWVFDGTGNVVPGWPQSLAPGTAAAGLAIGDIEFDGEPEIVVSTVHPHFPDNGPHPIYVFDRFGNIRDGWPITVDQGVGSLFNVTLVDLDGDYKCEIVGTGRGVFYAIDDDGTLMGTPLNYLHAGLPPSITDFEGDGIPEVLVPGAGVAVFRPGAPPYGFVGQYGNGDNSGFDGVVSADLTGDGVCEIVARCASPPAIHVLNQNLQLLPGWPQPLLPIESVGRRMVDLADLDLDGDLEIIQAAKFDMNAFDVPRDLGTTGLECPRKLIHFL